MIGRPINGEQAEHLAQFMDLHRQTERCAFEDRGHRADKAVGIVILVTCAAYILVNIFEVVV